MEVDIKIDSTNNYYYQGFVSHTSILAAYTPISPKIMLVPIVPNQYFWLIGRISAKQIGTGGQSRAITWEGLERSGAIASVLRESEITCHGS